MPKLEQQLVSLERRTTRGTGRDIIDHPQRKGAHDDLANAACGVIVMCSQGSQGLVVSKEAVANMNAHFAANPYKRTWNRRGYY